MALHQARYIASATIIGIILLLGWKDPEQPWMKMMFLAGGQHIAGMLIEFLLVRLYCRIEHRIAHLSGFLR